MSFKSGFESRERERESQFNTAGGSEFQVRGAAVLNDDVRRNGMHSSGTDDDRVLRVETVSFKRNENVELTTTTTTIMSLA